MRRVEIDTDNAAWRRVLERFADLLDRYEQCHSNERDIAYWYTEGALTGMLATAVWMTGGVALVQFNTERIYTPPEQSGKGLGDAWMRVGGVWHTVEAKIRWYETEAAGGLAEAIDQLRRLPKQDQIGTLLAVCYCAPAVAASRPPEGAVEATWERLLRRGPAMFRFAYHCIDNPMQDKTDGYRYPGIVAMAVEVEGTGRS